MTRYEHTGAAAETTIVGAITSGSTTINVTSAAGWPTGSVGAFWVAIDAGTASEEKVLVASRSGTALTVSSRGADGTTAQAHSDGAAIIHSFSATEADDANAHVEATTGHGATGAVVGTTNTQTLINKTYSGGTLSGTFTGTSNLPLGKLGYAQATANQSGIPSAGASLTGITSTVTVGSSRRVRITFYGTFLSSVNGDTLRAVIKESTTEFQAAKAEMSDTAARSVVCQVVVAPSAGSHTYHVDAQTLSGGTLTLEASSTQPAYILVEDIGAA